MTDHGESCTNHSYEEADGLKEAKYLGETGAPEGQRDGMEQKINQPRCPVADRFQYPCPTLQ